MSAPLDDLLFLIRQHEAFPELLKAVDAPDIKAYKTSGDDVKSQTEQWIFRSGRRHQHAIWRQFLIGEPSQQEKS